MGVSLTTEQFVKRAKRKHGNKYDYSRVSYKKAKTKVKIICKKHGPFLQTPDSHLSGSGCIKCGFDATGKKLTWSQDQFLERAKSVHGKTYNYSRAVYSHSEKKVRIICQTHGEFRQTPHDHLSGRGCPKCKPQKISEKSRKPPEKWMAQIMSVHGDRYDYSKAEITIGRKKIKIICSKHGPFMQGLEAHAMGNGCPKCGDDRSADKQRLTQDEWLERAMDAHSDRYDYSKTDYKGWDHKVEIICPIHDSFLQRGGSHIKGNGCQKCGGDLISKAKRWTTDKWIEKAEEVHGEKYDYSLVHYDGSWEPVEIICPDHGVFFQKAAVHSTMGRGCPKCGRIKQAASQTFTQEDFLTLAKERHGGRYDYSLAEYKPRIKEEQEPITIICREHGPFQQKAHDHLQGRGCSKCKYELLHSIIRLSQDDFIERVQKIHGTYYDYSRVEYRGVKDFIEIICPKHDSFRQRAEGHMDGNGCPRCSNSKGERAVSQFMESYGIEFEVEKKFDDCRRVLPLPFDFYLPKFDALIEFDGEQHFVPARWFSTKARAKKALKGIQERDQIKNKWAKSSGHPLFRIRYDEDVSKRMTKIIDSLHN